MIGAAQSAGGLRHVCSNGGIVVEQLTDKAGRVEARMSLQIGDVHVVRRFWDGPIDVFGVADAHRLELSLLPQPGESRGRYVDHWGPHRYERFGEMFLLPAEHVIHAKSECRQQYSIVCSFMPASVRTWFDGELDWTDSRLQASLDIASPNIRSLLFRLGEEVRNPGFASAAIAEMMAGQIAIELVRYCSQVEDKRATGGLSPWNLRLIDERLAEEHAPPSLAELAQLCGLSIRHLTRAFRISRCRSIGSYIAECRINEAKRLLVSGTCVKSIAYSMGFTSPSNFSTAFRRATGETPRQYRQRAGRSAVTH
jgi:AraC family transcriptional regulator